MNNPHDTDEYKKVDAEIPAPAPAPESGKKKSKLSGAYYYVETSEDKLRELSFIRTLLTVIAFMLQLVVLIFPQRGLEYITKNIPSYAYAYVWIVFIMIFVSVWLFVMIALRYKIVKRIPVEYAPKKGFAHRAYFGAELYMAVCAVMAVLELSFVCIKFDGWGLGAFFVCLLAVGASVAARIVTHRALMSAVRVEADPKTE